MDPVARAKRAFFGCLGASLAILLAVDLHVGPEALANRAPADASIVTTATTTPPEPTPTPTPTRDIPPAPVPTESASAEPPEPPPPDASPAESAGRITGVVATFEFEQANADLTKLKILAKQMQEDPSAEIVLEGHSDPAGNEYRNLTLSLDRANWAADRLVELGISRTRIRTVGLGSARAIVDVGGDAGAINRRVEVRWVVRSADGGGR